MSQATMGVKIKVMVQHSSSSKQLILLSSIHKQYYTLQNKHFPISKNPKHPHKLESVAEESSLYYELWVSGCRTRACESVTGLKIEGKFLVMEKMDVKACFNGG